MATIKLINGSKRTIKIGDPIKLHATKKNSLDIAILGEIIIGTAAQQISQGRWGVINLLNTVDWNDVLNKPTSFATNGNGTVENANSYFPSGW